VFTKATPEEEKKLSNGIRVIYKEDFEIVSK
jgi:hypothetical protein